MGTYLNSDVHLHYISLLGLTLATSKDLQGSCVDPKTNSLFSHTQSNLARGSSASLCNCDALKIFINKYIKIYILSDRQILYVTDSKQEMEAGWRKRRVKKSLLEMR